MPEMVANKSVLPKQFKINYRAFQHTNSHSKQLNYLQTTFVQRSDGRTTTSVKVNGTNTSSQASFPYPAKGETPAPTGSYPYPPKTEEPVLFYPNLAAIPKNNTSSYNHIHEVDSARRPISQHSTASRTPQITPADTIIFPDVQQNISKLLCYLC